MRNAFYKHRIFKKTLQNPLWPIFYVESSCMHFAHTIYIWREVWLAEFTVLPWCLWGSHFFCPLPYSGEDLGKLTAPSHGCDVEQTAQDTNNIIIYHDFLPTPRRVSHIKSDKTHTIIKIHPLAYLLDTWAWIFSSCALFTVYPNRIMYRYPSPLYMITTRAREGGPNEHRAKQRWPR